MVCLELERIDFFQYNIEYKKIYVYVYVFIYTYYKAILFLLEREVEVIFGVAPVLK